METPFLDKMIDNLKNHIESVEAGSFAGIPETRIELTEYEAIKQVLNMNTESALCRHRDEDLVYKNEAFGWECKCGVKKITIK